VNRRQREVVPFQQQPPAPPPPQRQPAQQQVGMQRDSHCPFGFCWALAWLRCALLPVMACAENRAAPPAPSPNEVLAEMSRRSAVPEAELKERLTSCDADQQSVYFCAFRE
jgi:hypothetical protein